MNWRPVLFLLLWAGHAGAADGVRYDLFGNVIDPSRLNLTGAMPAGELKLVLPPSAPRFSPGSRRGSRLVRRSRVDAPVKLFRLAPQPSTGMINVDQAVLATHVVKSGNRLILRRD